jgi:phage/plasmid-like protein (TIGR03299 family)
MAHLIDLSNARANMAYVGKTPWHGLGQQLTEGAPIEIWASEAGMDHDILASRVAFRWGHESGEVGVFDNKRVLYRSDNKKPLSVVSSIYNIVQPREILEFYRDLVDSTGDYQLETAGCLDDGKKYWALAKYKDTLNFSGDIVKPYLFLASSADGTMATTAMHTTVRVVCNNTLQMSLRADGPQAIKVSHSTKFNPDVIKSRLGVADTIENFNNDVNSLIDKALSREKAVQVFVELIAKRNKQDEITNEKAVKRIVGEIMASLDSGPGAQLITARGTAWGAMNAVTNYVDYKARAHSQNNRFSNGQFGNGAELKNKAFNLLMAA